MLEMGIEELEKVSKPRRSGPLRGSLPKSLEMQSYKHRSSEQGLGIQSVFVELRMMRNMIFLFISLLGATPRVPGRESKSPGVRGWGCWGMDR